MKKKLLTILVIIYVILAIAVTICLLSYNEYKVSVFGDKTLVIIDKEDKSFDYKKGDLIIVGKEGYEDAKIGDTVFFYRDKGIKIAQIQEKKDWGKAGTDFVIEGNYTVVSDEIIGTSNNQKVIAKVGQVLQVLESRWGFLILIVFPSLIAFLYEAYQLTLEIRNKK